MDIIDNSFYFICSAEISIVFICCLFHGALRIQCVISVISTFEFGNNTDSFFVFALLIFSPKFVNIASVVISFALSCPSFQLIVTKTLFFSLNNISFVLFAMK